MATKDKEHSQKLDLSKGSKKRDMSKDPIFFEEFDGENNWLSTTYCSQFPWRGRLFISAEQLIQCVKATHFGKDETSEALMRTESVAMHKFLGEQLDNFVDEQGDEARESWEGIAIGLLAKVNYAKFTSSCDAVKLRDLLFKTGDREIVAISDGRVWGCGLTLSEAQTFKAKTGGKPWLGRNLLGKSLMDLRRRLLADDRETNRLVAEQQMNRDSAMRTGKLIDVEDDGDVEEDGDEDWVVKEDWHIGEDWTFV